MPFDTASFMSNSAATTLDTSAFGDLGSAAVDSLADRSTMGGTCDRSNAFRSGSDRYGNHPLQR